MLKEFNLSNITFYRELIWSDEIDSLGAEYTFNFDGELRSVFVFGKSFEELDQKAPGAIKEKLLEIAKRALYILREIENSER
jgi:hypothetical protein